MFIIWPPNQFYAIAMSLGRRQNECQTNHPNQYVYQLWKFGEDWIIIFVYIWRDMPIFDIFSTQIQISLVICRWTKAYQISTPCCGNIATINTPIIIAILQFVTECPYAKWLKIGCYGNASWWLEKLSTIKYLPFGENQSRGSWYNWSLRITKRERNWQKQNI